MPLYWSGAQNKIGPELNGLDGRKAGSVPNYSYSDANKNSGIVWGEQTFKEYIKDPRAKIPGTKMIFPGVKNEQQANDLWAYIKQFDESGTKKIMRATSTAALWTGPCFRLPTVYRRAMVCAWGTGLRRDFLRGQRSCRQLGSSHLLRIQAGRSLTGFWPRPCLL